MPRNGAIIQIGRGVESAIGTLLNGEPAFATDSKKLLIGDSGTNRLITANALVQMSLTTDTSGAKLVGDSSSPGNNMVYGTNSSGAKGWRDFALAATAKSVTVVSGAVQLVNDLDSPDPNQMYGTDFSGTKGWFEIPPTYTDSQAQAQTVATNSIERSGVYIQLVGDTPTPAAGTYYGVDGAGRGWKTLQFSAISGTVSSSQIANNAIYTSKLVDGAVSETKLFDNAVSTRTIVDGAVTSAKLRNSAAYSVIGRSGTTSGQPDDISASADGQVLRRVSGGLGFGTIDLATSTTGNLDASRLTGTIGTLQIADGSVTWPKIATQAVLTDHLANGAVTTAKLYPLAALSVLGRSAATPAEGTMGAITASASGQVLKHTGTALAFGSLALSETTGSLDASRLTGTLPANSVEASQITDGSVGTAEIADQAITTVKVQDSQITNAKLRNSAGLSVVGRSGSTTGIVADITASTSGQVLQHDGSGLSFATLPIASTTGNLPTSRLSGTIATAQVADGTITLAKLASLAATSVIANATASSGTPTALAPTGSGQVLHYDGSTLAFRAVPIQETTGNLPTARLSGQLGGGQIEDSAITTSKIANLNITTAKLADNCVDETKLLQLGGCTVLCRSPNTTGQQAGITSSVDGDVLQRASGALTFAALPISATSGNLAASKRSFSGALIESSKSVANVSSFAGYTGFTTLDTSSPTVTYNTDAIFSNSNPSRLTAPTTGYYRIWGAIATASDWIGTSLNATNSRCLRIRKNGSNASADCLSHIRADTTSQVETSCTVYLASGDYVELVCGQNSGAARTTQYRFGMSLAGV